MDQTKSADSVSSAPVGERIAGDAAPPSSMNDLEALDLVSSALRIRADTRIHVAHEQRSLLL